MIQRRLHTVHILPVLHADSCEHRPDRSLRTLRWLIAGLVFLALFLVSLRAMGLV